MRGYFRHLECNCKKAYLASAVEEAYFWKDFIRGGFLYLFTEFYLMLSEIFYISVSSSKVGLAKVQLLQVFILVQRKISDVLVAFRDASSSFTVFYSSKYMNH